MQEKVSRDIRIRTADDKRTSENLVQMKISDTASATYNLSNNAEQLITVTLQNDKNLRLFGFPQVTMYVDSVSEANRLYGTVYTYAEFDFFNWVDWGSTDNNNIIFLVYVRNISGDTHDVIINVNFRYMIESAD